MHVSSFVNNPDKAPLHSNEYAAGTVSIRTFSQRTAIDKNRTSIGGYMRSQIASAYISRGVLGKPNPRNVNGDQKISSRQKVSDRDSGANRRLTIRRTFIEPSGRGYNPYE
jgi:hypothetical protein